MEDVNFIHILNRLKASLGFTKDKEVCEVLGLKETAFSVRKKRNSFPEKELRALAQQRPELGIDVELVLHGRASPMAFVTASQVGGRLRMERLRINWGDADMARHLGCSLADYVALEDGQRAPTDAECTAIRGHDELDANLVLTGFSANRSTWELDGQEQRLMQLYRTPGAWRAVFDAVLAASAERK